MTDDRKAPSSGEFELIVPGRGETIRFPSGHYASWLVESKDEDQEWRRVTECSLDEYLEHHDAGRYDEQTRTVMAHFQNLVFKYLVLSGSGETPCHLLDVGCGVGREVPYYVSEIQHRTVYVGLDPIRIHPERNYHFICAKVEDLAGLSFERQFDIALFATSLDHMLDVNHAIEAVRSVVKKNGYLIFWLGLHDSSLVAESAAARNLGKVFSTSGLIRRAAAATAWAMTALPSLLLRCWQRERRMKRGEPLDSLHFHYFREEDMELFERHGEVVESLHVPGTNSRFVVLRSG